MSAREIGGYAEAAGRQPDAQANRRPELSQVRIHAQAAGGCNRLASTCKTKTSALHRRLPSGMQERLGPPSGPATIPRITDPGTPPDLFNPAKGLSMEKTARSFLQLAMKSVPVADLLQSANFPQTTPGETVTRRGYTLCAY